MEDLSNSIHPLYLFLKYSGMLSYKILKRNRKVHFRSCLRSIFFGFIVLLIHTLTDIFFYVDWFDKTLLLEPIYQMVFFVQTKANTLVLVIVFTSIIYNKERQVQFFNSIVDFDDELRLMGIFPNHKKIQKYIYSRFAMDLFVWVSFSLVTYNFNSYLLDDSRIYYFLYNTVNTLIKICVYLHFETCVLIVSERFESVHNYLISIVSEKCESFQLSEAIKKTAEFHKNLCVVTQIINEIYSLQLLIITSFCFVTILQYAYDICCKIIDFDINKINIMILDFFWIVYFALILILFCRVCAQLNKQVLLF